MEGIYANQEKVKAWPDCKTKDQVSSNQDQQDQHEQQEYMGTVETLQQLQCGEGKSQKKPVRRTKRSIEILLEHIAYYIRDQKSTIKTSR